MSRDSICQPQAVVIVCGMLGFLASGCGDTGRFAVTGRVTYPDGSPLTEGMVICEMEAGTKVVMARSDLKKDGSFSLGTENPGDGAPPGKYRVLVAARALSDLERGKMPPFIDPKFENFATSGLQLEVKAGSKNELNIQVDKPKGEFKPQSRPADDQ